MVDCCNNPNLEDCVEPINSRDVFTCRNAIYMGESYYVKRCTNCGAVISSEYMSNGVSYDFDYIPTKRKQGRGIKYRCGDDYE